MAGKMTKADYARAIAKRNIGVMIAAGNKPRLTESEYADRLARGMKLGELKKTYERHDAEYKKKK